MKTILLLTTLSITGIALVVGWRSHSAKRAANRTLTSLMAQGARLDADIARFEQPKEAPQPSQPSSLATGPESQTPAREPGAATPDSAATTKPPPKPDTATALEAHAGLRPLFRTSLRATLAARYRSFYRLAGLSPEKIDAFEQHMIEAEETKMDFHAATRAQGFSMTDSNVKELSAQGSAQLGEALRALLGTETYQQLQEFQRTLPLQVIAADLAKLVAPTATPLSAAQSEQLVNAMAAASSRHRAGEQADLATVDWSQALASARGILTPAQYSAFQQQAKLQQVYRLVEEFYAHQKASPSTR